MKREALSLSWLLGRIRRHIRKHHPTVDDAALQKMLQDAETRVMLDRVEVPRAERWSGSHDPVDGGAEYAAEAEAERIALEGRPKYGDFREHFDLVAKLWTAYLDGRQKATSGKYKDSVLSTDVPVMMQLLKIARIATGIPLADNQLDIKGYGSLYNQLMGLDSKCGQQEAGQASSSAGNSDRRAKDSPPRGSRKNAKGSMSRPRTRARRRGTRRDT